ncbi:Anucleate primary sterigmata protein A [Fulvia fulva]|uniref:Anucleate primary sterigmata protein A n=1 Tax=Passalora fulva TaxID=5499 RepID=A0A9Q8PFZ3_PASFU|nr:Anucleate primary sterigmata protein A [Fulvia fulva]KAK4614100.1 Anucleate primary sterigmata protein A [Fulvia fulva]UJO21724.1 Anucleate primary sterigmata protein A [Fulvia fulva]WPV20483.1 Anucleate primary sterigmata protein A [Fulvia fulva]WPV35415.1 Anucleate primary sterigmata protein A [Fulvia fulva]
MADYFSEYNSFLGAKGLPSPADTPYETPAIIRSKRSSRVASSREHSITPPLPSDSTETPDKSKYSSLDPRRFTPTLHASLVSEILNLRRELDSKNHLVENLETTLSTVKVENETLNGQLSESAREVRKAKRQVEQMEQGTFDAVEVLAQERDNAKAALDDLRSKFENTQRKTRQQDEDSERTQSIWENEKEAWDNERRQLERRVHVTESRLRAVVEEMAIQQSQTVQEDDTTDENTFKDSGLGEGSDTSSIRTASPTKHKRNMSSISFRRRQTRFSMSSRTTTATPDLYARSGNNLADELGIDEEDEYDNDDSEHGDDDFDFSERANQSPESRRSVVRRTLDAKTKRILDVPIEAQETQGAPSVPRPQYHDRATTPPPQHMELREPAPKVVYVDNGYQPSPPASPPRVEVSHEQEDTKVVEHVTTDEHAPPASTQRNSGLQLATSDRLSLTSGSPISPPQTPVVDGVTWLEEKASPAVAPAYSTASTQTDPVEPEPPKGHTPKRDSLSPPSFVPSIAIHPPNSRPSSPRPYVLPPGTKNASAQANLVWPCKDASVQTEEIRIDKRPVKLPPHLLPGSLLPSPTFQEPAPRPNRIASAGNAKIFTKIPRIPVSSIPISPSAVQSPSDSSSEMSRNNSSKDLRNYPLKALPLPRPVLSPPMPHGETFQSNGPLNRSSQYGVSQPKFDNAYFTDADQLSEGSDYEDGGTDYDGSDLAGSIPQLSRPPPGRFGLSEPPKAVPEDKEISPERRPDTADSYGAAPAPSVSSSRANSQRRNVRQTSKLSKPDARKEFRSRSPSFGSMASTTKSAPPGAAGVHIPPPYPIPLRSSSRVPAKTSSEGSRSPTRYEALGARGSRAGRSQHSRQVSLRKVQSAAVIRNRTGRGSPTKGHRRRRRSPDLTPIQSMALEGATPTRFPIPELPTPVKENLRSPEYDCTKGSVDIARSPAEASSAGRVSEETNLVDAIAGTMVGEWMWKYIRKRKSFGIGEDSSEFPVADQNGVVNMTTGHGTRHKRWVWLSPYERTIMWDNKQPTSGPALLGKKGRKLAIQSVLDVEDPTPLPKNAELSSAWKRSILILTPERALKFTTTTRERHGLWMTALSFLAQSSQLPGQIPQPTTAKSDAPPIPPIPSNNNSIDGVPVKRHRASSFGRSKVRDSIRVAHGKRPEYLQGRSDPGDVYGSELIPSELLGQEAGADFPAVPRLYITTSKHQRKRSNTGPQHLSQPLSNFRSFSSSAVPSSTGSTHRRGGSSTNGSSYRPNVSAKSVSRGNSIASPDRPNFFEAVGTVRMEAFVDPNVRDGVLYIPAPPPVIGAPRRPRRGSGLSQSTVDKRRAGYVFDEDGMDPFKGF